MRKSLLVALTCLKLCDKLGYQFYAQDDEGCICAQRESSLHMISNLTARLTGPVITSDSAPPAESSSEPYSSLKDEE